MKLSAVSALLACSLLMLPVSAAVDAAAPQAAPSAGGSPGIPPGWFVWPAVEPAAESALDTSWLNHRPAGATGRITVRAGHFVTPDGERIRFWGANVSGHEAFPADAATAETFARRLARGGINIVRLHHLDNPWGIGSAGSIWRADRPERLEFDPAQLDRLHQLIAALARHGIYSNLNLKVSKQLSAADGFDASVAALPHFQKRADIYVRRMIELQRDYARRLLTTVNPYTGYAPATDPAVACIELNNENSLLGYWTRDLGRGLERHPEPFRRELQARWNAWLARRYADDAALATAWAPPAGAGVSISSDSAAAGSLLPAGARPQLTTTGGARAALEPSPDDAAALRVVIGATAGIDWHVQLTHAGIGLASGTVYTVAFEARASAPRSLQVGVGLDRLAHAEEPWRSFGLLDTVQVGLDWTPARLIFAAHSIAGARAALSFNAGATTGTLELRGLTLTPGAMGSGLQPGQSPRATPGTVPLPATPSSAQWADWIHFLADTERAWADEMLAYLRHDLEVQAPIVGSQVDYGGLTALHRETSTDFGDGHAYWQHPDFPADGEWDRHRWTIKNSPQLAEFGPRQWGELGGLALNRIAGRPYTVSEYDHPAPSEFVTEMYPVLASFAARQDWDGLYPFAIGADAARNPAGRIVDFFDQLHHPAKWGLAPFATRVFRQGLVPPAPATTTLELGNPLWAEEPHAEPLWRQLLPPGAIRFLDTRFAVSPQPGTAGSRARLVTTEADADSAAADNARPPVTLARTAQGPVYPLAVPRAAAVTGYLGGATVTAGDLTVATPRFGRDFGTVAAIALDGRPLASSERVLVTVVARAQNQGMIWNEPRTSVGGDWGDGPTIAEQLPATITLRSAGPRAVYALAPDGTRAHRIDATFAAGALTFRVTPRDATLHYELSGAH